MYIAGGSSTYFTFNHVTVNTTCTSYALCSSHLPLNGCTVQYTTDPSWRNLNPPVWGPMNTLFELPAPSMDAGTYFYQATVNNVVIRTIQEAKKCEEAMLCVSSS